MTAREISLQKMVGRGYGTFWNFRGRYCVCKGSRASKKSKTAALWHITKMMQYPLANTLVVRKVYRTLRDSCFSDLQWAINRLGVSEYWKATQSPLEMEYIPTGQKILFRGMDEPLKIASVSVPHGVLCWVWLEEAYEISKEADFDMLNESIRGEMPEGYFKRFTITFNPWNEKHWLKSRFFDAKADADILAITTNYTCNEWLDAADKRLFDRMRETNPRRYKVAGLGEWGVSEGLVFERWREENFDLDAIRKQPGIQSVFGLDFGFTADPSALFCGLIDIANEKLYVFDEIYQRGLTNDDLYREIVNAGYGKERITADSAEPKSIEELRRKGLRISGAAKGQDSIRHGIQFMQRFEIIIHPRCVNFLTEIGNYAWDKDKQGNTLNRPIDDFCHLIDAARYGLERFANGNKWMF